MYDINTKNLEKGEKIYFSFFAIGLLILVSIGGILIYNFIKLNSLDSATKSIRVDVNSYRNSEGTKVYSPIYYYIVDGREYSCSTNFSSSIYPGTSSKIVYYDSKNPSRSMSEYSISSNKIFLIAILLPLILIVVAVINIRKISKRVKLINELNQKGKLVKNLPYRLENTGMSVNNVNIQKIVVEYTLPYGATITLYGDPRYDQKTSDTDGMVDLVIDENNPDNYFIDFEINRLGGNLSSDYYNGVSNNESQSNNINYQENELFIQNNDCIENSNNQVEKKISNIVTIINKIYLFVFLLFWFGFLIVFDIMAIKCFKDTGFVLFSFSIIFWIVGICVLKDKLIKKK